MLNLSYHFFCEKVVCHFLISAGTSTTTLSQLCDFSKQHDFKDTISNKIYLYKVTLSKSCNVKVTVTKQALFNPFPNGKF